MIGNSVTTEIFADLALGASTAHISCSVIWEVDFADEPAEILNRFFEHEGLRRLPEIIRQLSF